MPVPTISTQTNYEVISSGVAYAKTLSASESPTSWALSGQPSGVTISSGGVISGTPAVTDATAYTFSATATNGTGTSDAVTWLVIVVPFAAGLSADSFTRAVNLDLNHGTLQIPGVGSPLPAPLATSPATMLQDGVEFTDETAYLSRWTVGDRFKLSLGIISAGVLQEPSVTRIDAILRQEESEPGIVIGELDLAATGAGTSARFETTIFLDPDLLNPIVGSFENSASTIAPMLLGLRAEEADDARDYDSGLLDETFVALTQSDSEVDSFDVNLPASSQITSGTKYQIVIALVCPSDTALNVTFTQIATITWSGSAYVLGTVTGDDNGNGTATDARDWDSDLENTSLTCDATGFVIETTVTTTAQSATVDTATCTIDGAANSFTTDGTTVSHATSFDIDFQDSGHTLIGIPVTISNGDTAAVIKAAIESATVEPVTSVTLDSGSDSIIIVFGAGTTVFEYNDGSSTTGAVIVNHAVPSYADAYVTCQVTGVEMPEKSLRIESAAVPILIERALNRA
jgi:hypothetical protein